MLTKEEYIDIIENLDFFYGDNLITTAELRKKKHRETQEKDLENFKKKINCLKQLINEHFELNEKIKTGELSDGYHTFNELYHHRAILFSIICNQNKEIAWKSKKHNDGTMYDGMFIVGINTPKGQYRYHFDIEPYWNMFDVKELENAPEWDGHEPKDIDRLFSINDNPPLKFEELNEGMWVWDNKTKSYIFIFKPLNWEPTKGIRYANMIINHSADGYYMDFEKNRFFRREVNNDE